MSAERRTVRLRHLSLVEEGEDVLVGDPETGTFVAMPAVGGVVISALRRGADLDEAAREAEAFAGEPVDVDDFVTALEELGFVEPGPGPRIEPGAESGPAAADSGSGRAAVRTAPVQGRRWLGGVRPELAGPLFGPVAWTLYAACAVFDVGALVLAPSLRPRPEQDAFIFSDVGRSMLVFAPFALVVMAAHECWHWLAARAAGVRARFGVDRRAMFLVFETDLSQLWAVPRRRRIGPLMAGLAFDATVLAGLLAARLALDGRPPVLDAVTAAWSLILITHLAWQCMVFLRTDLYAVLVTLAGCRDLWRVKTLMLRRAFGRLGRLGPREAAELAAAAPADLRVGRWFRWVWLGGFAVVGAWAVLLVLPVLPPILEWTAAGLAAGPLSGEFWYALGCGVPVFGPWAAVAALLCRKHGGRALAARRSLRHDRCS